MSDELWTVRAGQGAKYVDEFLAGSYVAVNFIEFAAEDLAGTDETTLRARVKSPAEGSYAGQLAAFAYKIAVGDLVIVPRLTSKNRDYLVARVTGDYEHVRQAPESGPHRRAVQWLGRFEREVLTKAGTNTMGGLATVFRPTAIDAELRGLVTALLPLDAAGTGLPPSGSLSTSIPVFSAAGVRIAPPPRSLVVAQLDIELDQHGRARIHCPHPALGMEQIPRHVDPTSDWRGVPGVYVLTGTTLEQSSTRTGNERTLTTTSIVRPWAYVGLSEDFMGRLSSHRQSKPEWRRALLVRSGGQPFSSDDIKYLEQKVHSVLADTGEVLLEQTIPRGNLSAQPRNTALLDACADTAVAVLRLTGTLI